MTIRPESSLADRTEASMSSTESYENTTAIVEETGIETTIPILVLDGRGRC